MAEHSDEASRTRSILAAAGTSGTWDWDVAEDRLHVDARFAELYGLDSEAALAGVSTETFFKAIHPADRARMRIAVAGILGGAELFSKEFRIIDPDGAILWMHGRGQSHFDADDMPVRFTGLLVDVTERKRTEERLRIAQSAGGIGTFEYVDGFATVTVSSEFCQLLGLHPASALPVRTINNVVQADHPPLIPQPGHGAIPETLEGVFCITRSDDGSGRWVARRGEILREGAGYRLVGVIYDVTESKQQEARLRELNDTLETRVEQEVAERREAEEALRQAQKMEAVGQLTGGIAHDFNNLLTVIIGNVDTVLRRFESGADPRARRSLESALKGAERAASLTQRLLAFSRRQPLEPKTIDVARLLAGMSDLLTRSISESIAIQIVTETNLWRVEADPHQLENVILNLAVNARDAMPAGGGLTIDARNVEVGEEAARDGALPGDYVAISVSDSGIGMSPETVAKVFDPFFTTKEVGKGTGLGLSMVYGFVKQSGGHVTIDSTEGEGTTVRLFLERKLDNGQVETAAEGTAAEMGSASETVLVVEDDDEVRAYTVGILRELGYRVVEAHDGVSAIRLLEREDFSVDLLLSDVVMPRMSGQELADKARAMQPDLKVLFASGYTRDTIMRDGRLEAGVDLISKPFTFVALAAKVRDVLDRQA
ncbi:PAS domain-containing hybrid sensor histidine kinase/response regulator [Sphingomonas sp. LM7]|uniref:PAS domain-containing hybrid sensor histidine kinase/response regulator n=1 Tax=Sphingomonas sp. LM7 TaxID=1938607 RepID=UPI000983E7F6|nr:PAS domain-containing hybrid sensor histidine kinase/response regulator [Sphingomonas sp. LM7]AQR72827.1 hybrid sensor histidine kinase/response regulator [Sphingomonas sp. LM7]